MKYKVIVLEAERLREEGQPLQAANLLQGVEHAACLSKRYETQADALAQRILCFLHMAKGRSLGINLNRVVALCQEGIDLAYSHPAAAPWLRIFQYRMGDAKFRQGKYQESLGFFHEAESGLPETDDKYPEFASYLGLAMVYNGDQRGLDKLGSALTEISRAKSKFAELDRWMIHHTGVLLKIARAEHYLGNNRRANSTLFQAEISVNLLRTKYKKPRRAEEFQEVSKLLGTHRR